MIKKLTLLFIITILMWSLNSCKSEKENRPNIILILADDLGWSDIGCYGSEVQTPNLDRLASQGMRFTQFHNTSKCFPSRATLITGVYAQDCGYDKTFTNPILNAVTFGEVLQDAGYLTYWSGKHHGKENPYDRGFNHYFGLNDGCCNYFNPGITKEGGKKPAQKTIRQWCIDSLQFKPYTPPQEDFYTTDYFTNYAIEYVNEAKTKDQPFFLYLAYTAPHDPLMAWPDDIKKYKGKYDLGYEAIRKKRYEKQLSSGLIDSTFKFSEATYVPWDSLSADEQLFESQKMEVYAAMIDRLDQNIGRLYNELDKLGFLDNTVILFVSDNGASAENVILKNDNDDANVGDMDRWVSLGQNWANVCNTPFRYYKNYSYEGGISTPLIAWWPKKIQANSFSKFRGHLIDIMPTLIELSGAKYPEVYNGMKITPLRGQSLLPTFEGKSAERKDPIFWEWKNGQALLVNNWKIVKNGLKNPWDLYNVDTDPTETNNLASQHPEKVAELDSIFNEWHSSYNGSEVTEGE